MSRLLLSCIMASQGQCQWSLDQYSEREISPMIHFRIFPFTGIADEISNIVISIHRTNDNVLPFSALSDRMHFKILKMKLAVDQYSAAARDLGSIKVISSNWAKLNVGQQEIENRIFIFRTTAGYRHRDMAYEKWILSSF